MAININLKKGMFRIVYYDIKYRFVQLIFNTTIRYIIAFYYTVMYTFIAHTSTVVDNS